MQDDDHYYVEGYSAELDPYALENGVLKNNFGITDSASLNEVEAKLDTLFSGLAKEDYLHGANPEAFGEFMGKFLVQLNFVHPFREGNGRVQRLLVTQIATNAGLSLDWQPIGNEAMKQACIAGIQGESRPMARLIWLNIKPFPV